MQLKGQPAVTLTAGQTFYEGPTDVHIVGRNASTTEPARFVVVLLKAKGLPSSRRCKNDARHRAPHPPPISCTCLARTPGAHERQVGMRRAMGGRMQTRCVRCRGGALQGAVTWQ